MGIKKEDVNHENHEYCHVAISQYTGDAIKHVQIYNGWLSEIITFPIIFKHMDDEIGGRYWVFRIKYQVSGIKYYVLSIMY